MRTKKRVLPALLLSLFAGAAAPEAEAAQFSNVYVFGDSYSDAGYYRPGLAALGLPASVVATLGRFTTNPGPVWSELVAQHYGVTPGPSNAGGTIYAQGGSRTATDSPATPPFAAVRSATTQINEYMTAHNNVADPGALYTVLTGGNDFLGSVAAFGAGQITSAQLQAIVLAAATAEVQQVGRLFAAGARYVMVLNYPDPAALPAFAGFDAPTRGLLSALGAGSNTTLFTGLASNGFRVIPVDLNALTNEMRANPSAYGFTNITGIACGAFPPITTAATASSQFCTSGNLVAPNADRTYMWADGIHPTSATHRIWADFAESLIDGPSQYGLLAEAALRSRESHIRSLADGIAMGRADDVGKFSVFVSGDHSDFQVESGIGLTGLDSTSSAGTVGMTMRASESVVVGAAYGTSRNNGTFGSGAGDYKISENVWSLFASVKSGGFYANGVLSLADLKFAEMKRNIVLGPVVRVAEGRTEGSNSSAHLAAGYDFSIGRGFKIGPTVSLTTQNIDVNAFDESGAGSASLRILDQKRKSEVWSAGLRASYGLGQWTPWVRVTADKERKDDARDVSAIPLTMAAIGNSYAVPTYRPDTSFVTAAVGLNGNIMPNVGMSVGYYRVDSRNGIKQDGVNGMVSVRF